MPEPLEVKSEGQKQMAGTSEKEQRTVMGLEAAVRVEAEFPTRPGEGREWEKPPEGRESHFG